MREVVHHFVWAMSVLIALSGSVGSVGGQTKTKPVTTHLSAKWAHTPLLLEASEYMAEENTATFWGFIQVIAQTDPQLFATSKFDVVISVMLFYDSIVYIW